MVWCLVKHRDNYTFILQINIWYHLKFVIMAFHYTWKQYSYTGSDSWAESRIFGKFGDSWNSLWFYPFSFQGWLCHLEWTKCWSLGEWRKDFISKRTQPVTTPKRTLIHSKGPQQWLEERANERTSKRKHLLPADCQYWQWITWEIA
jgi:hypothetical protein